MSILSSLYHGEIHDRPNDVHDLPAGSGSRAHEKEGAQTPAQAARAGRAGSQNALRQAPSAKKRDAGTAGKKSARTMAAHAAAEKAHPSTDGSAVLPQQAQRRLAAQREGHLRPALYYTQQEQTPCASGVWESPHTVASKLESKEEFPQG